MKKVGLWFSEVLALVLGICCLVACGSNSQAGTYRFSSMKVGDKTFEVGQTYEGIELTKDFSTITLSSDGTAEMKSMGISQKATWKANEEDSGKVDITVMNQTITVECSGGTITMEQEGVIIVLKK